MGGLSDGYVGSNYRCSGRLPAPLTTTLGVMDQRQSLSALVASNKWHAWCMRTWLLGFAIFTLAVLVIVWGDNVPLGIGIAVIGFTVAAVGVVAGNIGVILRVFSKNKG